MLIQRQHCGHLIYYTQFLVMTSRVSLAFPRADTALSMFQVSGDSDSDMFLLVRLVDASDGCLEWSLFLELLKLNDICHFSSH